MVAQLDDYKNPIPEETEERERWKINDLGGANWCLRKLRAIRTEQAEARAMVKAEMDRLIEYQEQIDRAANDKAAWFESRLCEWHLEQIEADPKKKTIKLPLGTLKIRAQQPEYKRDDIALVEWLKANSLDGLVKVEEKPNWAELKKSIEVKGEKAFIKGTEMQVEGVVCIPRGDKFEVALAEVD